MPPSPLTPIGFDIPGYQPTAVRAPQQLAQPDTTGLQVLAQSAQQAQSTIQQAQQNAASQASAVADIAKSQSQSVQAISQAAAQESQIRASRSSANAQSFAQLGDTILKYTTSYAKQQADASEAARKAMQQAQKNAAVSELENLRVDWIEKGQIDRQGTSAYRDAVATTLSRYEVEASDVSELTQKYFDPALDYAKKTESNRQQTAEDITKQQRRITVSGLQAKTSASLGGLRASVGLSQEVVDGHYNSIRESIGELMRNEDVPILDRLTAVATALESTNTVMQERNVDTAKLNNDVTAFGSVIEFANKQQAALRAGTITIDEYSATIKQEAMRQNLPGFTVPDANASEKYIQDTLSTADSINDLKQKKRLSQLQSITAKDDIIGALATQFILDPTSYLSVQGKPEKELDPNAKAALQITKDFIDWRDNGVPKFNASHQGFISKIGSRQSEFERWFASASRDTTAAQRDPNYAKILEAGRMGQDPNLAALVAGKRPLTQEDVDYMQQTYHRQMENDKAEADVETKDYNNKQARFAKYGLYLDVNSTKAANKVFQGGLQKYRQQLAEVNASSAEAQTQPGNSPNFNGGAPGKPKNWKPLAVGNYGGNRITFPFTQNVAATLVLEGGQGFTASRGGGSRQHNALDFAVPIGTPVQSLVYGSVIAIHHSDTGYGTSVEVKGDDGYTYHYAHLSKTSVVKNERVGAGQTLALSGDTGSGSGPHLHFDLLDPNGKIVDPMTHLASRKFGDSPRMPRSSGNKTGHPPSLLPADAIPLGGNSYLSRGKIIRSDDAAFTKSVNYSKASPLRNSYATKGDSSPAANHGYSALAKDPPFARALNAVAKRQGIPSQWLADLISVESAGSFSASIGNGLGYYGLIQFGSAASQDLGVTQDALTKMTPAAQMVYVEKYLNLQKRYAGISGNFKSVAELIAAVNQGHTVLRDVRNRGQAAIEDPGNHDGAGVTLKAYINMLGKYSGRRYDSGRADRVSTITHTRPRSSCTNCNAMAQQDAFIPHEAQNVG